RAASTAGAAPTPGHGLLLRDSVLTAPPRAPRAMRRGPGPPALAPGRRARARGASSPPPARGRRPPPPAGRVRRLSCRRPAFARSGRAPAWVEACDRRRTTGSGSAEASPCDPALRCRPLGGRRLRAGLLRRGRSVGFAGGPVRLLRFRDDLGR